jgi:putative ATPase
VSTDDLFAAHAADQLAARGPLAARMRPRSLDEVVGQQHLVGPDGALRILAQADRMTSVILWGPPGSGKTTLASLLASTSTKAFIPLSAVSSGVKEVREVIESARHRLGERGQGTVLFLDEVHRFNKSQQDLLLPSVEEGLITLIGATTENPYFEVNAPLLSRSTLWRLNPLSGDDLGILVERGCKAEGVSIDSDAVGLLLGSADGDARALLTTLEVSAALATVRHGGSQGGEISTQDVKDARDGRVFHQGRDEHYDQISAFIKSIRGSDADAGLYWMARLLEAGESPRFIARRLVILASEDIGMADSLSLVVAEAAARAVEFVGMPEAGLNLAHAVVHLATAPKSNRVTVALAQAQGEVREGPRTSVPAHLRDAHYRGASEIGHGDGYLYPHDEPSGWAEQRYLPEELGERTYYVPSPHGREAQIMRWREEAQAQSQRKPMEGDEHHPR